MCIKIAWKFCFTILMLNGFRSNKIDYKHVKDLPEKTLLIFSFFFFFLLIVVFP